MTFLIIKINEYDVGAGDLADPLYRLPSECVTALINNLEQMRMRLQRWPDLSGGDLSGGRQRISGGRQIKYISYLAPSDFRTITKLL